MEIKVGSIIKYDSDKSNWPWHGKVLSIAEKSVKVEVLGLDSTARVKLNKIVSVRD